MERHKDRINGAEGNVQATGVAMICALKEAAGLDMKQCRLKFWQCKRFNA